MLATLSISKENFREIFPIQKIANDFQGTKCGRESFIVLLVADNQTPTRSVGKARSDSILGMSALLKEWLQVLPACCGTPPSLITFMSSDQAERLDCIHIHMKIVHCFTRYVLATNSSSCLTASDKFYIALQLFFEYVSVFTDTVYSLVKTLNHRTFVHAFNRVTLSSPHPQKQQRFND